jgi:hypothetical protein
MGNPQKHSVSPRVVAVSEVMPMALAYMTESRDQMALRAGQVVAARLRQAVPEERVAKGLVMITMEIRGALQGQMVVVVAAAVPDSSEHPLAPRPPE